MRTVDILKLARKKLLENTQEIFSDDDLLLYGNMTKDELAKRYVGNRLIKKATLVFTSGAVTRPTDWNGAYFINDTGLKGGNQYKMVNIGDFYADKYPYMVTEEDGNLITNTGAPQLTFWYYKKLTDMASGETPVDPPIELDDFLHELIIYGIVYRGFEDAQDFELSKYFKDKFEAEYTIRTSHLSGLEESPMEAGELFQPLPDLNFSGYQSQDPNRW